MRATYAVFRRRGNDWQHWNGSAWVPHVGQGGPLHLICQPRAFLDNIVPNLSRKDAEGWFYWFIDTDD